MELEQQMDNIKKREEEAKKIDEQQAKEETTTQGTSADEDRTDGAESVGGESEKSKVSTKTNKENQVDSAKISALTIILDDFENILSKNFCQFANYEDFSFAKSRTSEALQD